MAEHSQPPKAVLSFGRFALSPNERLLTEDGVPVEIGGRALDMLIVLASRPNEVLGKRELMAAVWPDVTVEETSLRFHIASLRKVLGEGRDGARYIATLAGRGYCFVAPVTRSGGSDFEAAETNAEDRPITFLPARHARIVGREDCVRSIVAELAASRFVSIVGPGGVGKTTVAVAVAYELMPALDGAVLFVDFGLLTDPRMVPVSVASMLGLAIQSDDPVPGLIALLRERRMLVVLDNCEHVIEEAARFTEQLFMAAPEIRILTTSREALRVEGERVHRLAPLEIPPEDVTLTAEDTLDFPSARLFVERATAGGARLDLGNEDARIVAGICRKLDGMALAIELAAGRVETYGLQQTAALLDERFTLLWPGQRTAPARQKTLRATLDWSYGLLTTEERIVFRRLAVFVGSFTIEAALSVVTGDASDSAWVFAAIDSLVAKSMVTAFPAGTMMRYRLLDTARAYALDIEMDLAERKALSARHVAYCLRWLEQFSSDGRLLLDASRRASHLADINNVRAALEWCFGDEGSTELGIDLAVAATPPVLFSMSLLTECQRWSHLAIRKLDGSALDDRREMRLQAALGLSLMWTSGNSEASFSALNRSIVIAKQLDDPLNQILLLTPLHVFHMRVGEFGKAMQYARQISALTQTSRDPVAADLSRILLGYSFHFAGELSRARHELEVALRHNSLTELAGSQNSSLSSTMIDDAMAAPILALASAAAPSALAKTLWLQGRPAAARVYINRTIADAASANHPVTILVALLHAISVLIWSGDFDEADDQIAWFIKNAQTNALKSYFALGNCFKAQLAVSRGDTESGVDELRHWLSELHAQRYEMLTASFDITLAHGLGALGRHDEGLQLIVNTARLSSANGDMCYMPELLRVRASLLPSGAVDGDGEVERCLAESIAWSRRQGALAWELRASIDLAALRARQDRLSDARAVLEPVVAAFTERFDTADLRTAERLLATLG